MSQPLQQSLQGYSEFVKFEDSMDKSLCGISQKIPIDNASLVNRRQLQKDKNMFKKMHENENPIQEQIQAEDHHQEQEQANQFLNVGKWSKKGTNPSDTSLKNSKTTEGNNKSEIKTSQIKNQSKVSKKTTHNQTNNATNNSKASKWNKSGEGKTSEHHQDSKVQKSYNNQSGHHDHHDHHEQIHKSTKQPTVPVQPHWHKHGQRHAEHSQNNSSIHIHKSTKQPTVPIQPHWHQNDKQKPQKQEQQQQQQVDQQEQEEESEESSEEEQESESEEEQQEESEEQDENEDSGEQQVEEQQEQEEEQQDKFNVGLDDGQSSQAFQTQIANTSAFNATPKPSKWAKKKPLQTMTKYQIPTNNSPDNNETDKNQKKDYHTRLNSATYHHINDPNYQAQDDAIVQNVESQEWHQTEKVLLRLKLLLG